MPNNFKRQEGRLAGQDAGAGELGQRFAEEPQPQWARVDLRGVRVERVCRGNDSLQARSIVQSPSLLGSELIQQSALVAKNSVH